MDFFGSNKSLVLLLLVSIATCFFLPSASGMLDDSELLLRRSMPLAPAPAPAHHHKPIHPPLHPPAYPPHHKHAPAKSPAKPPAHPPVHPPAHPPHHKHAPAKSPAKPPVHPPVKPPAHPPVKPPVHPPVHPPVKPPAHPPVKPPVHPPVKPPVHPPVMPPVHSPISPPVRSFIVVEGVVYCQSCKYKGNNTLVGAKPISGAVVKLECKNTKYRLVKTGNTDKNGYFLIEAPRTISSYAFHKCKVSLVSSPLASCKKPGKLHGGSTGADLKAKKSFKIGKVPFTLYSVGPFAFEPTCPLV